ncbi:MAG: TonB C-terminal domain-containing protein [Roseateles sp.]|uniref:TonB C-terminal domain-containing protein n=1 Tax=Roseateles sp. TaxID=1971397 RepID=UPI004037BC27
MFSCAPALASADAGSVSTSISPEVAQIRRAYYQQISMLLVSKLRYKPEFSGQKCSIEIEQSNTGEVINIAFLSCRSEAFQDHVRQIVQQSSPLPLPSNPEAFVTKVPATFYYEPE